MINYWVKTILLIIQFFTHLLKNGSSSCIDASLNVTLCYGRNKLEEVKWL